MTEQLKPEPDALEWDADYNKDTVGELEDQELPDYDDELFKAWAPVVVVEPIEGEIGADN